MLRGTDDAEAFGRRLAILVLLHTQPRTYPQLQAALAAQNLAHPGYDPDSPRAVAPYRQFRRDLDTLHLAGCEIACDHHTLCYHWVNFPFGLALDDAQLFALGIVLNTFEDTTVLHQAEIAALLEYLVGLLPPDQQRTLARKRRPYTIDLRETTDYCNADPQNVTRIERAIEQGQQLEFVYRNPRDGVERTHTVEPRPLVYRDGHVYLPIYNVVMGKAFDVRLDRIVPKTAKGLPHVALRSRPPGPKYRLCYRLSPTLASDNASTHFTGQQIARHPDGSTTITAEITDLFAARRIVLAYGEHCTVLSPPELVADIRRTAAAMYQTYCTADQ